MGTNTYLRFEDPFIKGESTSPGHAGEIEVLSWSHAFAQPTGPRPSTLSFTKYQDSSTKELLQFSWSGKQIGKATLHCYRSDGPSDVPVEYLTVTMEHVIVSNYSVAGGPGDVPLDNISLDYGLIHYDYKPQKNAV